MCGTQWTTQTENTAHNWETESRRKTALHERTLRDKRDPRRSAKDAAQKALA